ncbi:MAG: YebC/PmpR family DNA-binding transcriptional regulator [Verrucomicrobia bacterium]|nr:MAG: YebC/PmpR family DNA-binding transcriptional regulator [Verrucomicrobiota bacterium]
MAGHSKWATTKRHKAAVDAKRGKIFSLLGKELTLAARSGGGDPEFNPRLRTVINAAKAANMPSENVERAIKKGTGELAGQAAIEEMTYEGYGPEGVGIIVEVTTDNKNRTAGEVRSVFTKSGGSLASPGALDYNFQRKGQFLIDAKKVKEEDLLDIVLEAGAEDVINNGDYFEVLSPISEFYKVSRALEDKKIVPESAELAYIPSNLIAIKDPEVAKKLLKMVNALDDLEDVKNVYANFDIEEKLVEAVK